MRHCYLPFVISLVFVEHVCRPVNDLQLPVLMQRPRYTGGRWQAGCHSLRHSRAREQAGVSHATETAVRISHRVPAVGVLHSACKHAACMRHNGAWSCAGTLLHWETSLWAEWWR